MDSARDRKRDPHHCLGCGVAFDVSYYDDRVDDRVARPPLPYDVRCPRCGHAKSISLPFGAERTLVVEVDEVAEVDEGGGG